MAGILFGVKTKARDGQAEVLEEESASEWLVAVLKAEEWSSWVTDGRADEAKGSIRALRSVDMRNHERCAEVEWIGFGQWQEKDGIVFVPSDRSNKELGQ